MYLDETFRSFIGNKVTKIYMNSGQDIITFVLDNGNTYSMYTYGDCCSSSYIDSINGIDYLLNNTILSIKEITLDYTIDSPEFTQFYSVQIKTERGLFEFIFRNESNGYYGGYLEHNEQPTYEVEITEDFIGQIGETDYKASLFKNTVYDPDL